MPRTDEIAVSAFERPAEMQADISDGADFALCAIDVKLAAEERNDAAAGCRHVRQLAQLVFHRRPSSI